MLRIPLLVRACAVLVGSLGVGAVARIPVDGGPQAALEDSSVASAVMDAGGSHTCMLTKGDGLACWGANDEGQLGDGTRTYRRYPVMVQGLAADVRAVATGYAHTCALMQSGAVRCWGDNLYGALGNGTNVDSLVPVDVVGLQSGVVSISAGMLHTCAVLESGSVRCWGRNATGELGDGTTADSTVPVSAHGVADATAVEAGGGTSCVLTRQGGVKCWGQNQSGTLGDGSHANSGEPVHVLGLTSGVAAITMAYHHACALTFSHDLWCWGVAGWGQLGARVDGANSPVPVAVDELAGRVVAVSAGHSQTCAILDDHSARCWGLNSDGELGDGTAELHGTPVVVSGFEAGNTAIAAGGTFGEFFTCARSATTVQCWGDNGFGQLGAPSSVANSATPRRLELPAARLVAFGKPWVIAGRRFDAPLGVQVEDVLGNSSRNGPALTVTLEVTEQVGELICSGGLSVGTHEGFAVLQDCSVSKPGLYRLRATAPQLAPAELSFLALAVGGVLPQLGRDAPAGATTPPSPTPTPTALSPKPSQTAMPTPTPTHTATVQPGGKTTIQLHLVLDRYDPSAAGGGWSNYEYTLFNDGTVDVDLSELTLQSWYSLDTGLGGADDCAAAGHVLGPGAIAPGDSISLSFGANLEPNPQFWPQCVDRTSGYVVVEVHSRYSTKYVAGSWIVSYPVTR